MSRFYDWKKLLKKENIIDRNKEVEIENTESKLFASKDIDNIIYDQNNLRCKSLPNMVLELNENNPSTSESNSQEKSSEEINIHPEYLCKDKKNCKRKTLTSPTDKIKNFNKNTDCDEIEDKEWFLVEGRKKEKKKTFMEDGGTSVLPMSTGYFPRPAQGQSLTSFLTSENFSRRVAELDRENAHFSISEAMISAIEQMKCNRQLRLVEEANEEDSDEEINQLKQRIRIRRRQRLEEKNIKSMWSTSLLSDGKTDSE